MPEEEATVEEQIMAMSVANSPPFCVIMGAICGHLGVSLDPVDFFGQYKIIECATIGCSIRQYARVIAS